jgi:hypothetical protein
MGGRQRTTIFMIKETVKKEKEKEESSKTSGRESKKTGKSE